ncbi:MAG: glycoside hydrolase family 20 zincin-like fold domain-containing protein [Ferruginibacter sp.]
MKKIISIILSGFLLLLNSNGNSRQILSSYGNELSPKVGPPPVALLPVSQHSKFTGKRFTLDKNWKVNLNNTVKNTPAVLSLKEEFAKRYALKLKAGMGKKNNSISFIIRDNAVKISNTTDTNRTALIRQAYHIELRKNQIIIIANAAQGLYYGTQSLLQLLQVQDKQASYPEGELTDWPDMDIRMIYWDDAHHLEKMDVLKREIKQAAYYKINGFAIKLEGHFQYQSAPPIVEPHALSAAQFQELTNFAAAHYVQLVPYLDAPAHVSFILKHPEYKELRAFPNSNYQFSVTNPKTYQLVSGMFKELIDANKGVKYVLLSNDEAYYTGKSANEIDSAKSLGGNGKLLARFISRLADTLKRYGRKVIFWGEYPLTVDDIKKLPTHLINGVYDSDWASAFEERGIRQLIYTSTQGEEPLFPNYYPLPAGKTLHEENAKLAARVPDLIKTITKAVDEKRADIAGVIVAGWADAGLHPQAFWLGYATGAAMGWNHSGANADELAEKFYTTYYGTENAGMKKVYELTSRQAQFYEDSWLWESSNNRTPIFGNHAEVYDPPQPANDQQLLILPVPGSNDLSLKYNWADSNYKRLQLAESFLSESEELILLLNNLNTIKNNQYSIEVIKTIALLCRQNISMLFQLKKISELLAAAAELAGKNPGKSLSLLDQSLDLAALMKLQRNDVLGSTINVWYKDWLPLVREANGRKYLHVVDDVKDHRPIRTADMSYLIYRELMYPMDKWADETVQVRNKFALRHSLKQRVFKLQWKVLHKL